jgi:hypothetical protein
MGYLWRGEKEKHAKQFHVKEAAQNKEFQMFIHQKVCSKCKTKACLQNGGEMPNKEKR